MTLRQTWKKNLLLFLSTELGLSVRDQAPYIAAFTHGSSGDSNDYQRLEFLGDRVLALAITQTLYFDFPDEPEGSLSVRLNRLVSRRKCAIIAREIGIGPHIRLGKQARDDGGRESVNILGDVMEALIGAIYVDQGIAAAMKFVSQYWSEQIEDKRGDSKHPKSQLQEWAAANKRKTPEYKLLKRSGPHHSLDFVVAVHIKDIGSVQASGKSKQEAETAAARKFLEQYG